MAFTCTDEIELALQLYQFIRKDRSEWIQASATSNGHTLHLPDGEEQRRRDDSIRAASRGNGATLINGMIEKLGNSCGALT